MKSMIIIWGLLLSGSIHTLLAAENSMGVPGLVLNAFSKPEIDSLYGKLIATGTKPSYVLFSKGMSGYASLLNEGKIQNSRYLTLIDFSLSSKVRRLWVIDLNSDSVVHHSLVAHGKNTGEEYAVNFSNRPKSNMSSLGFYVTGSTYYGKHGFSLLLDGVEEGINDNARKRAIVIHPAAYATQDFSRKYGRLGRSFGCPALPPAKSEAIIDTIKDKSCLFIYHPNREYQLASRLTGIRKKD